MTAIGCAKAELTGAARQDNAHLSKLCRALLARLLHERTPALFCLETLPEIQLTELGKPYFRDYPELFFSFSHTNALAVCALGDVPLGVDAEYMRDISEGVRRRFLAGCTQKDALQRWTERESYGKMTGEGFFYDENAIIAHTFSYYAIDSENFERRKPSLGALKADSTSETDKNAPIFTDAVEICKNRDFDCGYLITLCLSGAAGTVMANAEPPKQIAWY